MTTAPKRIGFLSFGAWHPGGGMTSTGGDALRQTVELAVAAEAELRGISISDLLIEYADEGLRREGAER